MGGVVQEIGETLDKNTGVSTQVTQSYDHTFTGGISRSPDNYDSSYGYSPGVGLPSRFNTFKGLPADFTSYGKVPPPGITSIEIKPIGEQGTVREATINIICHNLAQFKIIDALYLRLKYSILLEWGHSIYFDNNQKLITDPSYDLANGYFLSNGNSSDVILDKIEQTRIKSGGNYDGFLGYVTNFNWTHRGDGGYNITVFARGMGDIIESLKVNVNYPGGAISTELPPLTEEEINSLPLDVTPDQYPPTIFYKNKSTLNQILFAIKRYIDKNGPSVSGYATNDISLGTANISQLTLDLSNYEVYPNYADKDEYTSGALVTSANNILVDQEGYRAKFENITTAPNTTGTGGMFYYIKLGTLLRIIESFLLKYDTSKKGSKRGNGSIPLFYIDHDYDTNMCFTIPKQISYNPKVCLIKPTSVLTSANTDSTEPPVVVYEVYDDVVPSNDSFEDKYKKLIDTNPVRVISEDEYNEINLGGRIYVTNNPDVTEEPKSSGQVLSKEEVEVLNENYDETFESSTTFGVTKDVNLIRRQRYVKTTSDKANVTTQDVEGTNILSSITPGFRTSSPFVGKFMHILVNLDFISSALVNNLNTDGDLSVYDFLKDIMNGIQASTGHINDFKIIHDEDNDILYIKDYNVVPGHEKIVGKQISNIPTKLNVNLVKDTPSSATTFNGKGSFVTDVELKTELTNNFATQITVAAQADGNKVGVDATALSKLNIGYTDRVKIKKSSKKDDSIEDFSAVKAYSENLQFRNTLIGNIDAGTVTDNDISVGQQALTDLYKYEIGQYTKDNNIPGKSFIPVNLHLTMDGISGIKLFQSYTINDEILPKSYRNAIKFVNRGVTHKVDLKNWITTLDSFGGPTSKSLLPLKETSDSAVTFASSRQSSSGGTGRVRASNENLQKALNELDTQRLYSIQRRIVREAAYWHSLNIAGVGNPAQSFNNQNFQDGIYGVKWNRGNHWCNFFTSYIWKNAYSEEAKNGIFGSTYASINAKYFNNWEYRKQKLTAGFCPTTVTEFQKVNSTLAPEITPSFNEVYPGDMITFYWGNSQYTDDHIGIVIWYDKVKRRVGTIEGNSSNAINYNEYNIDGAPRVIIHPITEINGTAGFLTDSNFSYSFTAAV